MRLEEGVRNHWIDQSWVIVPNRPDSTINRVMHERARRSRAQKAFQLFCIVV